MSCVRIRGRTVFGVKSGEVITHLEMMDQDREILTQDHRAEISGRDVARWKKPWVPGREIRRQDARGHYQTMWELPRGDHGSPGRQPWAPDTVRTWRQGTRRCHDAAAGHQTLSGRTGQRGLCPGGVRIQGGNKGKSGRNVGSTWRPNSQLMFCASGASDAQDAQDAS